jgi:DNA-binding CsgD family transcriptional regulator
MDPRGIDKIHEQLFAAVAGDIPFSSALQSVIDAFGGAAGVLFEVDRTSGVFKNWLGCGVEAGEQDYMEHINAINPRMRRSLRHAAGSIIYEGMFIDEQRMDRSEFYDWLGDQDLRYFLGSRLHDEGDISLFTSVEFTPKHGHPDTDKIEAFKRMAPLIGTAWRASKNVATASGGADMTAWAPDHLPWAIFAIDHNGTVVKMNASARELLASGDAVCVDDGTVRALDTRSAENLKQVLQRGTQGHCAETLLYGAAGRPPLIAQIIPTNPARIPNPSPVVAVLYIWNPARRSERLSDVLARLYGFTQAEARLAQVLCSGVDLSHAAGQLGITRNTARNQLQSVFAKTGTRRQNELVVSIWGVLDSEKN